MVADQLEFEGLRVGEMYRLILRTKKVCYE